MQKYENLKHYVGQKINAKVIKRQPIEGVVFKKLVSQEILISIGSRKKICFEISRILDKENVM